MASGTYYQMYKDGAGEWRWRFRAANHETIAMSSEGYVYRNDCRRSIDLVKSSANSPVHEV